MTASTEIVLDVKNLTTEFTVGASKLRPVNDVSFSLHKGQTIGIVGESGSGKTMTAMSILGLLPPELKARSNGSAVLNGENLVGLPEASFRKLRGSEIALIPQDPQTSLNPVFTIGNQITEAISVHGNSDRKSKWAKAAEILGRVRIADPKRRLSEYPHQISGGMRQRVVGGIAISCAPSVIIADEPTTALDVTVQKQYLKLLKELQAQSQLGIIFITHDFGVVASVCDYVLVMYAGRVVEQGAVRDIFDNPMHPYTRALLGSIRHTKTRDGKLPAIGGQPPSLGDLPQGCAFAPRCTLADARCRTALPPVVEQGGQQARCWKVEGKV